jgi:inactivated superfamily I helicase
MSSPADAADERPALLMVRADVPAEIESQFNDGYNREDLHLDGVLMLEAASEHGASAAISHLNRKILEQHGATPHLVMQPSSFRVLYTMHA